MSCKQCPFLFGGHIESPKCKINDSIELVTYQNLHNKNIEGKVKWIIWFTNIMFQVKNSHLNEFLQNVRSLPPAIKQLYSWKQPYIPAPGSEQVCLETLIFTKYLANLFNTQYWWSHNW